MEINTIKRIDLPDFLRRHNSIHVTDGKAQCPFHPPDKNPSFSVYQNDDGTWAWKDFHPDGGRGSIIDFVVLKDGLAVPEAIRKIKKLEGIEDRPAPARTTKWKIAATYDYTDENGKRVFQKIRYIPKSFACRRPVGDSWEYNTRGVKAVPYRLDKIKAESRVFLCEGEKDADRLAGLGYPSTSAPWGAGNWPAELSPYFRGKAVFIVYDVGNEAKVQKIAAELWEFTKQIMILTVPIDRREADVSDFLDKYSSAEDQRAAFEDLIFHGLKYEQKSTEQAGVFVGNLEEFMAADIAPADPLVDPFVYRTGLSIAGGVNGSHKSFFVIQLGLHAAAGKSPFLNCPVPRSARVLLIQQEISVPFMQERLAKIRRAESFDTHGRFVPITTTGKQLKLLNVKDLDQIKKWIDLYQPELLILDPISTFHDIEENNSREMARVRDVLNKLKSVYQTAVLVTQHFSSKRNPKDPLAPVEVGGWFRGHTTLTDAADVLIALHRLHGQRENTSLARPFEDYNEVQVQLRNGRWPERFAIEFDEDSFLLRVSDVWHELGRKIVPEQIIALLHANDGEMRRTDILTHFSQLGVSPVTTRKALDETVSQGLAVREQLIGKGSPVLIKLRSPA